MKVDSVSAWATFTPAASEIMQVQHGRVELDVETVEANRFGLIMRVGDSVELTSGTVYYHRRAGKPNAIFARVAV